MDSTPVIFDISSDEEQAWEEPKGDDYDWLSKVLVQVDKGSDDPDEVVVIREVNLSKKSKSSKPSVNYDDDCIVLDGDPDKPVEVVNDEQENGDDLVIVGQKGEIACRDFPHPRHHCAKFQFSSTPHEKHCELCHCFVCDSRAPCAHWGTGISSTDHCNATDKEERWTTLRKSFRHGINSSIHLLKFPVSCSSMPVSHVHHVPCGGLATNSTLHSQVSLPTCNGNSMQQSQVSRPSIRVCSSTNVNLVPCRRLATNFTAQSQVSQPTMISAGDSIQQSQVSRPARYDIPNIMSHSRTRPPSFVLNRSTFHPQKMLGVRNTVISRNRGVPRGLLNSHFISSNTISKRVEGGVASTVNQNAYGSPGNINSADTSQHVQNPVPVVTSNDGNPHGWQKFCPETNLGAYEFKSCLQPSTAGGVFPTTEPLEPAINSQHIHHSDGQNVNQHEVQSQPITNSTFADFDFGFNWEQPPVENFEGQTKEFMNEHPEFNELDENAGFFDWFLENQSHPVVQEGYMPPESNVLSPEPTSFDSSMSLFDFEPLGMV